MKGVKRNSKQGIYPVRKKDEDRSHISRCDGTDIWRDKTWKRGLGTSMVKLVSGGQ
jgi:hypothetical protein